MRRHVLVSVPSRGSRLSNKPMMPWYPKPSTCFRPLAGFKVIQRETATTITYNVYGFPSPRGVQGYPTSLAQYIRSDMAKFPSPRGVQGYPTAAQDGADRPVHDARVSVPSRGSRLSNSQGSLSPLSLTRFRPLAGFKVIQHSLDVSGQL